MSLESINRLAELTGRANKTIKGRLEPLKPVKEGAAYLYESKEALPLIYDLQTAGDLDITEERARLAHHQANKTALEEAVLKGDLIPAEEVLAQWERLVSGFRAKMLAMPTKTSHLLVNVQEFDEIESILKSHIYEALKELSNEGTNENIKSDI